MVFLFQDLEEDSATVWPANTHWRSWGDFAHRYFWRVDGDLLGVELTWHLTFIPSCRCPFTARFEMRTPRPSGLIIRQSTTLFFYPSCFHWATQRIDDLMLFCSFRLQMLLLFYLPYTNPVSVMD